MESVRYQTLYESVVSTVICWGEFTPPLCGFTPISHTVPIRHDNNPAGFSLAAVPNTTSALHASLANSSPGPEIVKLKITRHIFSLMLAITLPAGALAAPGQTVPKIDALVPGSIKVPSTEEMFTYLRGHEFEWPVANDDRTLIVPRIVINDLPNNWEQGLDVASRKSIFIRLLAPLILLANEQINADRTYILDALASGHGTELRSSERYKLIVNSYRLPTETDPLKVLKRVDIIPPALAISQAILESGWGTSRFAAEGNALYGEWVWGGGMEPMQRDVSLGDYGVRSFSSLLRSALSYMQNLNTSHHYQDFRDARMDMRLSDKSLDACNLASHLSAYAAVDGKIYREILCDLIKQNDLHVADSAVLASTPASMLDFQLSETRTATTGINGISQAPVHAD